MLFFCHNVLIEFFQNSSFRLDIVKCSKWKKHPHLTQMVKRGWHINLNSALGLTPKNIYCAATTVQYSRHDGPFVDFSMGKCDLNAGLAKHNIKT